jgi:phosphoribosyl 1,2-cyclic phosphate phosphodiesterase
LSDCSGVPDDIAAKIQGVEVLIIDALRHKPHPTHLSVDQALEVGQRVHAGKTYFTHICHELAQSDEAGLPSNTFIGYDGLKLEL